MIKEENETFNLKLQNFKHKCIYKGENEQSPIVFERDLKEKWNKKKEDANYKC